MRLFILLLLLSHLQVQAQTKPLTTDQLDVKNKLAIRGKEINPTTTGKLADLRAATGTSDHYVSIEAGKEGAWYWDANDTRTLDNTGTVLVTKDGKRLKRIFDGAVNVDWFGAKGDGISDDKAAIQAAINNAAGNQVKFNGSKTYKVSSTISLPANTRLNLSGATIKYAGNQVLFDLLGVANVSMENGTITATSGTCIRTKGSEASQRVLYPSIAAEALWCTQLSLSRLNISGFKSGLQFENFTREIWINNCYITNNHNALTVTGKVVNMVVDGTVFYSDLPASTAITISGDPSDTRWRYPEGLFFSKSIMDVQGQSVTILDVFDATFSKCQIKSNPGQNAIVQSKGTSPMCKMVKFDNCIIQGGTTLIGRSLSATYLFDVQFSGCTFDSINDDNVQITKFASGILFVNNRFINAGGKLNRAFYVAGNQTDVIIDGVQTDHTFNEAVVIDGANPVAVAVRNIMYRGNGSALISKAPINVEAIPSTNEKEYAATQNFFAKVEAGSYKPKSVLVKLADVKLGRGARGFITLNMPLIKVTEPTLFEVVLPPGIITPKDAGWDSKYVYVVSPSYLSVSIPFYTTGAVTSTISLTVNTGAAIQVGSHGFIAVNVH